MKKIINGKKYNTETAKECGSYWNGLSVRDFSHFYETLYKKKTGEFFLHGQGGPSSRYHGHCGDLCCGGQKIVPLTIDEAKEWVERHLDADDYEEIFGEVEE